MVKSKEKMRWKSNIIVISILIFALFTCNACYLLEQTSGQLDLRFNQVPIEEALKQETDPAIKALLEEVQQIKQFAETHLHLKSSDNYSGYYHTEKRGITFVVTASKKNEFIPYTWWFPIIGSVPYKGFFEEQDALELEAELKEEGYDTWLFAAPAYSSLGWFKDPITTPMLKRGMYNLASTIIHEMTHVTLYVDDQSDFNEQLAAFVGQVGAIQYFKEQNKPDRFFQKIKRRQEKRNHFSKAAQNTINLLKALYQKNLPQSEMLEKRQNLFNQLTSQVTDIYPNSQRSKWQFNNARLLQYRRYRPQNPELKNLWQQSNETWDEFWPLVEQYIKDQNW